MLVRLVALGLLVPLVLAPQAGAAPVSMSQSGEAGEWLVYYQPFLAPTTGVGFSVVLDASTTSELGEPVSLFVMPPTVVYDRGGSDRGLLDVFEAASVVTQAMGGTLDRQIDLGAGMSSSGLVGIVIAVAASHAWTLDLTLDVASGSGLGEPVILRGHGALFASAAPSATPFAGVSELALTFPTGGWTHLASDALHVQPVGTRTYQVSFPNGYGFSGAASMAGANAVLVGTASSQNYWGGLGATSDAAGTLHAAVSYREISTGVNLGAVHLPQATLPAALTDLNYRAFDSAHDVGLQTVPSP